LFLKRNKIKEAPWEMTNTSFKKDTLVKKSKKIKIKIKIKILDLVKNNSSRKKLQV